MCRQMLLLGWAATMLSGAERVPVIAISGARLVTVSGAEIDQGVIVLRGGLIEAVGAKVAIPGDASVIDGRGLTIYPGLIDGLSSWGLKAQPAPAPNVAAPRVKGPEDRPQTFANVHASDLANPDDTRLVAARAAGFTSAASFPVNGVVTGEGALLNLAGERPGEMVVVPSIGQHIVYRLGPMGFGRRFPSSLMGNIAYVRQLFLDAAYNQSAGPAYREHPTSMARPEYDADLEALQKSPRLLLPAVDVQQIDRTLRFGKELGKPFVVYGGHEAFRAVDELKAAKTPVLVSLKWPEKPRDADPDEIPDTRDLVKRDQAPAVPGLLQQAGVRFAFYSDGIETAPELRKAIKRAIDKGLSRAGAVKALTLDAASIYGAGDRLGSLQAGKIANLIVVKGELFDEASSMEYVFVDGMPFRPSDDAQHPKKREGGGAGSSGNPARTSEDMAERMTP